MCKEDKYEWCPETGSYCSHTKEQCKDCKWRNLFDSWVGKLEQEISKLSRKD